MSPLNDFEFETNFVESSYFKVRRLLNLKNSVPPPLDPSPENLTRFLEFHKKQKKKNLQFPDEKKLDYESFSKIQYCQTFILTICVTLQYIILNLAEQTTLTPTNKTTLFCRAGLVNAGFPVWFIYSTLVSN